jgi:REP element-mobilizing transposase RayT
MKRDNIIHIHSDRAIQHINYRLAGSIPKFVLERLKQNKEQALVEAQRKASLLSGHLSGIVFKREQHLINGKYEMEVDSVLDKAENGPYYLSDPFIAQEIIKSLKHLHERKDIYLYAVCVMSNHVHVLIGCPEEREVLDLANFMRRHKSFTANLANRHLDRTGLPFWEKNYFDRMVRRGKFSTVMSYVLNNPVAAGLVHSWRDWRHTFLNPEFSQLF